MRFIKAVTLEGKTVYFNLSQVLTITDHPNYTLILMGAGLFYKVLPDTMEFINDENIINDIMGGY